MTPTTFRTPVNLDLYPSTLSAENIASELNTLLKNAGLSAEVSFEANKNSLSGYPDFSQCLETLLSLRNPEEKKHAINLLEDARLISEHKEIINKTIDALGEQPEQVEEVSRSFNSVRPTIRKDVLLHSVIPFHSERSQLRLLSWLAQMPRYKDEVKDQLAIHVSHKEKYKRLGAILDRITDGPTDPDDTANESTEWADNQELIDWTDKQNFSNLLKDIASLPGEYCADLLQKLLCLIPELSYGDRAAALHACLENIRNLPTYLQAKPLNKFLNPTTFGCLLSDFHARQAVVDACTKHIFTLPIRFQAETLDVCIAALYCLAFNNREAAVNACVDTIRDLPIDIFAIERQIQAFNGFLAVFHFLESESRLAIFNVYMNRIPNFPDEVRVQALNSLIANICTVPLFDQATALDACLNKVLDLPKKDQPQTLNALIATIKSMTLLGSRQAAFDTCLRRISEFPVDVQAQALKTLLGTVNSLPSESRNAATLACKEQLGKLSD